MSRTVKIETVYEATNFALLYKERKENLYLTERNLKIIASAYRERKMPKR